MDAFQIRLDFLSTLKRLTATQQSIAASLSHLSTHLSASSDLWTCLLETCTHSPLASRINLLFLISSLFTDDALSTPSVRAVYLPYLIRDATTLLDLLVPAGSGDAVLNLASVRHVLAIWKTRHVLPDAVVDALSDHLDAREARLLALPTDERPAARWTEPDVLRRIEDDRERHKRLREGSWILPPAASTQPVLFGTTETAHVNPFFLLRHHVRTGPPSNPKSEAGSEAASVRGAGEAMSGRAVDVEFDRCWEETSDLNSDDAEMIREESALVWSEAGLG